MSRKGKAPIELPSGVEIKLDGSTVNVKGPKGSLSQELPEGVSVAIEDRSVTVAAESRTRATRGFHGLYRTLIANMVEGVSKGFQKNLEMIGVGYRAAVKGSALDLQVGKSHPEVLPIPEGVQAQVEKNTKIQLSAADKQLLGQFAAKVRAVRPPEPYKGKGIRYEGEYVRRKAGKAGK